MRQAWDPTKGLSAKSSYMTDGSERIELKRGYSHDHDRDYYYSYEHGRSEDEGDGEWERFDHGMDAPPDTLPTHLLRATQRAGVQGTYVMPRSGADGGGGGSGDGGGEVWTCLSASPLVTCDRHPSKDVAIRNMDPITFQVVDVTKLSADNTLTTVTRPRGGGDGFGGILGWGSDSGGSRGGAGAGAGRAPCNTGGFEEGCNGGSGTAAVGAINDGQRIGDSVGVIDSVPYSRAFFELFEGAIYLHQARQYMVLALDVARAMATVKPVRVDYYTQSRNHTDVDVTKVWCSVLPVIPPYPN